MYLFKLLFSILYMVVMIIFAVYGVHRYWLLFLFYKNRNNPPRPMGHFEQLPRVTIQLPMYNEKHVVERLIDAVCAIRYPRELLEIQVLDDSTDETCDIARRKVNSIKQQGFNIVLIHRDNRTGYKAGALENGLKTAGGEFVMIFDADFIPAQNILEDMIHFFTDPKIGLVQSRWGHINRDYSTLTEIQSIFLDGHFTIEHCARSRSGRYFNFNGTAGIWRKEAIRNAGGWQHDTLTEDLDLSYRAQLRGWKFVFVKDVICPAELPMDMNAFKSQQHHWTKGTIQTCLKMLPKVLRARVPLKNKIEAFFHLTGNFCYLLMVVLTLMLLPSLFVRDYSLTNIRTMMALDLPLFFLALLPFVVCYLAGQVDLFKGWTRKIIYVPVLISVGVGLILNNAKAVLEALFGHQTAFPRTPKYNVTSRATSERWRKSDYKVSHGLMPFIELAMGVYFLVTCAMALYMKALGAVPILLMFSAGTFYVGIMSLVHNGAKEIKTTSAQAPQTQAELHITSEPSAAESTYRNAG